jgi:protein-tyrosine-phosphatase
MAMGLMQARVDSPNEEWRIESAGTWAVQGAPPAVNTKRVLLDTGIDINEYRSRQVTFQMMDSFRLILTMEHGHKEALSIEFPELASRVYLLSEMIGENYEIQDPILGPLEDFRVTAKDIEQILTDGFNRISELSKENDGGSK